MSKRLVIVESPTKAKTLKRFLGADYVVESSIGHIRDLPASAAEVPEEFKKEPWARLGVDVDHDFKPLYVIQPEKKKKIAELRKLVKAADELYLATDEDREGEAISWHLLEVLAPKMEPRRMVFHEITKEAVLGALEATRTIDMHLVNAQEARRIGYEVSPILWRKIAPRLSAGRVQSVAVRMLVERELARMRFRAAHYWDLMARFGAAGGDFSACLVSLDGKRMAEGKDFDPDTGKLAKDAVLLDESSARGLAQGLQTSDYRVSSTEEKPYSQYPAPPFTTSTLQQEGGRKLRFSATRTMRAAQRLYESGYITYMRTDSVVLSDQALRATRRQVEQMYGHDYLPPEPRYYKSKVKNAQEAHEAIRPAGESFQTPAELAGTLGSDELKVYELIWQRTMACQMREARGRRMTVRVTTNAATNGVRHEVVFQATGKTIDFPGFLRAYVEGSDDPDAALEEREVVLPPVSEGDRVDLRSMDVEDHETQPPPRFTEASLVKALEEAGIGRPSTYASIIDTIERREYSFKKGTALVPTFTAFAVVHLMTDHFTDLIDPNFTARMEDRLDSIARGEEEPVPYLREFYFGDGAAGLRPLLQQKTEDIDPREVCSISIGVDEQSVPIVVRVGRYGPFLQRGEDTAPVPDGICPDELTIARALELLAAGAGGPQTLGQHPETQEPVYLKNGRFGPYVQLGEGSGKGKSKVKPKTSSLLPGQAMETLTLEQALALLSLPRVVGLDPEGQEVTAMLGRYGPYIKRGKDTRSLPPEDSVLTVSLERTLELLAQEKKGRGFRAGGARTAAAALKVFEKVPGLEGKDVKLLKGRYGPYVTDGETNASLPRDFGDPESLTAEQAAQLILERRAKGPSKKRGGGRRKK